MVTPKKKVVKKKVAAKKTADVKPINPKLHVVLGDALMVKFDRKCNKLDMKKSDVTRVLIEYFIKNELEVTPPSVTKRK